MHFNSQDKFCSYKNTGVWDQPFPPAKGLLAAPADTALGTQLSHKKHAGRSGGTAVLVRTPLQIHRGDPVARCTVAIVPWTRTTRLHLVSVYGVNRSSPDFHTGNSRLQAVLQIYLAGLRNFPWVLGGDWNIELAELPAFWQRRHILRAPPGPTQKFGRVLDWFLTGPTVPSTLHNTQIIPGTDHVAVALRLRGALRSTLGFRARQPQGISLEAVRSLGDPQSREPWEHFFGDPPSTWDHWTRQAEDTVLLATDTEARGNRGRGAIITIARQRISRPQVGPTSVGINLHMHRLRLRIAQHDRLLTLESRGATHTEAQHLRRILLTTGYPTQQDRDLLLAGSRPFQNDGRKTGSTGPLNNSAAVAANFTNGRSEPGPKTTSPLLLPPPRGRNKRSTSDWKRPPLNGPNYGKEALRGGTLLRPLSHPSQGKRCDAPLRP